MIKISYNNNDKIYSDNDGSVGGRHSLSSSSLLHQAMQWAIQQMHQVFHSQKMLQKLRILLEHMLLDL